MSKDQVRIFYFVNLLSVIASIAGTTALSLGVDLQLIGGWLLLIGSEAIFWLMLERKIQITRYFGLVSSFILLVILSFIIIGDYSILISRYDIVFLLVYLLFRVFYLVIPPSGEITFPILLSTVFTVFAGILLVFTDDSELLWTVEMTIFICGEILYIWKRNETLFYHRLFGFFSSGLVFLILLVVFVPLENTPDVRLDLLVLLIYAPFRIIESTLPKSSTKGRTLAFQLSYSFLGFGLLVLAISLEVLLALVTSVDMIPSYSGKTWYLLEISKENLKITQLWELGGYLEDIFHSLEISLVLIVGLIVFIFSEIMFVAKLGFESFTKKRELTRDTIYFKLHSVLWYLGILVASYGYFISMYFLNTDSNFQEASNWIMLLSLFLVVYLLVKLIMNCITTTFWGPITITLVSQIGLIASILITYEVIIVENIQIEPFMIGVSLGIVAVIFLLIATYTITERLNSFVLFLWAGWSTIELVVSIIGLIQQNNELILVAVPLTILTMLITVVTSRERWWATSKETKDYPGPPASVPDLPGPPVSVPDLPSPPQTVFPRSPDRESSKSSEEQNQRDKLKKKMLKELNNF